MAVVDSALPSFSSILGSAVICLIVMLVLFGISVLQVYLYYMRYPDDKARTKILVLILSVLDTVHTILVCHTVYGWLETTYNDPVAVLSLECTWSMITSVAVNIVSAVTVQCFYAFAVYRLSRKSIRWWLTAVMAVLIAGHAGFGIHSVVALSNTIFLPKFITIIRTLVPFAAFTLLSDLAITISLCVLLYKKRTGVRGTNQIVNTLVVYAVNRLLLATLVLLIEVIGFVTIPNKTWPYFTDFLIGKLYTNSLLGTLNSRNHIRNGTSSGSESIALSSSRPPQSGETSKVIDIGRRRINDIGSEIRFAEGMRSEIESQTISSSADKRNGGASLV